MTAIPADRLVHHVEPCTVCGKYVSAPFERTLGTCDAAGYDGFTDDGEPVCTVCWCPVCHNAHDCDAAFTQCETDNGQPVLCDSGEVIAAGTIR